MSTPLIPEEVILALHQELIRKFGGASGVRNHATLRGILLGANQTYAGIELYPHVIDKAVYLCVEFIKQHPFVDGNKRVAAVVLAMYLEKNDYLFSPDADEYYTAIVDLTTGNLDFKSFKQVVLSWVRSGPIDSRS